MYTVKGDFVIGCITTNSKGESSLRYIHKENISRNMLILDSSITNAFTHNTLFDATMNIKKN